MSYRCRVCGRSFGDNVALMQHAENNRRCSVGAAVVHRGVSAWEGSRGQQVFTSGRSGFSELVASEEAFDGYEYVCCICDRGWPKLAQLNQHLGSGAHDGSDNYECRSCGATFSRLAQILQHQKNGNCGNTEARLGRLIAQDYSNAGTLLIENGGAARYEATLYFDGGARPNPGQGGAGFYLEDCDHYFMAQMAIPLSNAAVTNNQAEYAGLIKGLRAAQQHGVRRLHVKGDSNLVIQQMRGAFAVNSPLLAPLYAKAKLLVQKHFTTVHFEHIYRDQNYKADDLATDAIHHPYHQAQDIYYL